MSNLLTLKQVKFLAIGLVALAMLVGFSAVAVSNANAAYESLVSCPTMMQGSSGSCVMTVQTAVGASADGIFGPMTRAAVIAWQGSHGLVADGIVGPMTKAAIMAGGPFASYPAGCTSSVGYSTTTGQPCNTAPTLPAGCTSAMGFSPTTGAPCNGGSSSTNTGGLTGGAGDVVLSSTSTDVEDTAKEGEEDVKIFGVEVEADGSDIAVTSMKLSFKNCEVNCTTATTTSSENLTNYIDEVTVWMGDDKVGSVDADELSRDSGDPDEYSKTVTLSNAIVREDDDAKFYVAITAASNIDTDDIDNAEWEVILETMRFVDATGAILSADVDTFDAYGDNPSFSFEDASTDDDISVKTSSANPDDETVKVEDDESTDDVLALAFKLEVDEDSADVDVTSMTIEVDLVDSDTSSAEDMIDSVIIKIGGDEFEADFDSETTADADYTATYIADIDSGDLTIGSGDTEEAKVYISFHEQDEEDNYANDSVVTASLTDIDAETEEDEIDDGDISGTPKEGAELTLNTSSASVTSVSWTSSSTDLVGTLDFFFTVSAEDEDFDVTSASIMDVTSGDADFTDCSDECSDSGEGTLSKISGDATFDDVNNLFTVADGDTARFRVRYTSTATGSHEVTITSVAGNTVDDDDQLSPTITLD